MVLAVSMNIGVKFGISIENFTCEESSNPFEEGWTRESS